MAPMRGASDGPGGGDHFEALYRGSYKEIFAYVLRRTGGDAETVADLVAEVFVVALRKQDILPPSPEDRLWLYGVARRVVLDHQRRDRRWLRVQSQLRQKASSDTTPGSDGVQSRVREAMEKLKPADREALQLVVWDGLSHSEAAQVLGITSNAVALRLHKARSRLRRILASQCEPAVAAASFPSRLVQHGSGSQQ
jgi:RNA polymerase sigma factor (sigma-70 family)